MQALSLTAHRRRGAPGAARWPVDFPYSPAAASSRRDGAVHPGLVSLTGEEDLLRGGRGDDLLGPVLVASADSGQTAEIRNTGTILQGGAGNDILAVQLEAVASDRGQASLTDNVVQLKGGDGNDDLSLDLFTFADKVFGASATVSGNTIRLDGGDSDGSVRLVGNATAGNSIRLEGGAGTDIAALHFWMDDSGRSFDFSVRYDQVLFDGTALDGFERADVIAGWGDDTFRGGSGDNLFDGAKALAASSWTARRATTSSDLPRTAGPG